jgi:HEAT repeat protein
MSNSRELGYPNASPDVSPPLGSSGAWQHGYLMPEYVNQPASTGSILGYTSPLGNVAVGSTNAPGAIVLYDNTAFVSISTSSSTTTALINRGPTPSTSYTFVSSLDQCTKIFSAQCDRVSNFIFNQLEQIDRSDDDRSEAIAGDIANVIGLVGEPAACTAFLEANLLRSDPTVLEPLLIAIATAQHKETETARVKLLQHFAGDANYRVRRAAVRALGRMGSDTARNALREISTRNEGAEIGRLAAALLR